MMLYTIVIEFKDDSYVIQNEANSVLESIERGVQSCLNQEVRLFNNSQAIELHDDFCSDITSHVAINDLKNVWVVTFLVDDCLVQFTIVATK